MRGLTQRAGQVMRLPVQAEPPFRLIARVDEHGPTARAIAGFDIVEDVADEPGLGEVDLPIARSAPQPGLRHRQRTAKRTLAACGRCGQ